MCSNHVPAANGSIDVLHGSHAEADQDAQGHPPRTAGGWIWASCRASAVIGTPSGERAPTGGGPALPGRGHLPAVDDSGGPYRVLCDLPWPVGQSGEFPEMGPSPGLAWPPGAPARASGQRQAAAECDGCRSPATAVCLRAGGMSPWRSTPAPGRVAPGGCQRTAFVHPGTLFQAGIIGCGCGEWSSNEMRPTGSAVPLRASQPGPCC